MAARVKVTYDGPFFRNDPSRTFRENVHDFMDEVTRSAAQVVLASGLPRKSGRLIQGVQGGAEGLKGQEWRRTGAVQTSAKAPWASKGREFSYAKRSPQAVKAFKAGKRHVYRARANNRELLKGLT